MRQRSSLAHELAYVIFEDHTLEPSDDPSRGVGKRTPEAPLASVVQRYLVSPAIAAIATLRGVSVEELLAEFARVGLEPKEHSQRFEANE